jgi:hypothetical protein
MPPFAMPNQRSDKKKQITAWLMAETKDWLTKEADRLGISTTDLLNVIILDCKNKRSGNQSPPPPMPVSKLR